MVAGDAKAVSIASRDVELALVLGREPHARPSAIGGRSAPNVHGYVENLAHRYANQLGLPGRKLIVQSAQGAPGGEAVVVLDIDIVQAVPRELAQVVAFHKEPTAIGMDVGLDNHHPG